MPLHLKSFTIPAGPDQYQDNDEIPLPKNLPTFLDPYPFHVLNVFNDNALKIKFDKITLFYGNNGSGKSTLLNIIAEKIKAERYTPFNGTICFNRFCYLCEKEESHGCDNKRIIASDEIFEKMLTLRDANIYKVQRQKEILKQKLKILKNPDARVKEIDFNDMESIQNFKNDSNLHRLSFSKLVKLNIGSDIVLHSNGETAYDYFVNMIE